MKSNKANIKSNYNVLYYIILISSAVLIYLQTLGFGFTASDDKMIIQDNSDVITKFSNIGTAFKTDAFLKNEYELYRPLQTASYFVDAQLSGTDGWAYHLTNIILHSLVCVVLFVWLKKIGFERLPAFLISLIYAVNPLFDHAVAWVPARGDLFMTLFSLLSFIYYINFKNSNKYGALALHQLFFLLALLGKESAVLLPFMLLLYYFLRIKTKETKLISLPNVINVSLWLLIIVAYTLFRRSVISFPFENQISGIMDFLNNTPSIPETAAKFVVPYGLSVIPKFSLWLTAGGTLLILLLAYLPFRFKKLHKPVFFFGLVWLIVYSIPGMLYNRPELAKWVFDYSEHRTYIAMLGLSLIFADILNTIINKNNSKYIIGFVAVVALIYAGVNFNHAKAYASPLSYYTQAVSSNPGSPMALYNLGLAQHEAGDALSAVESYTRAIAVKQDFADAYNNRGWAEISLGRYRESIVDFTSAIKINKEHPFAYNNRGLALHLLGQENYALDDINKSLRLKPDNPFAYLNRAKVYIALGSMESACIDLGRASAAGLPEAIELNKKYCKK